ncbi:MAG: alpha/beta hydrolase [Rhodothermales bacterium]
MIRCLLLALLCTATAHAQPSTSAVPDGLLGRWAGASIENGTPRLFELAFSTADDGSLRTELTLPYNGYDRFPFAFTFTPGGAYDGVLTSDLFGDAMRLVVDLGEGHLRGTVTEGDSVTARVHLQKVVAFDLPPIRVEDLTFTAGRDTLAGSLFLPVGAARPPAVVLVAGRGYGARSEMSGWARLLARNGVAALAFDGRGTGRSTGDSDAVTGEDRFDDVRAALDALHTRGDLGPVGLMSNSAGGWIVPGMAAERDDVAFVVTLVGPAESLADQQGHVTTAFMRASGERFSEAEYAEAFAYQRQTVVFAQADAAWADFERINAPARAARWSEHALIPDRLDDADLDYFRRRRAFAAPPWDRVRVPVLAVYGEDDPIVPPADNVPRLRAALAANPDVTVLVLPGADHSLARPVATVGEGAWPDRFYRPWTRSPLLFDTLVAWFGDRFGAP